MTKHSSCHWLNNLFVDHEDMIVTGSLTVQAKIVLGHSLVCWYVFIIPCFLSNISSFILKILLCNHTCNARDEQFNRNHKDYDKSGKTLKYHLCVCTVIYT